MWSGLGECTFDEAEDGSHWHAVFEDHLQVLLFPVLGVCMETVCGGDDPDCVGFGVVDGEPTAAAREIGGDVHSSGALSVVGPVSVARDDTGCEEEVGVGWGADQADGRTDGSIDPEGWCVERFVRLHSQDGDIGDGISGEDLENGGYRAIGEADGGDGGVGMIHRVMVCGDDAVWGEDESAAIAEVPTVAAVAFVASDDGDGVLDGGLVKCGPVRGLCGGIFDWAWGCGDAARFPGAQFLDEGISIWAA